MEYLTALLELMITADANKTFNEEGDDNDGLPVRVLAEVTPAHTSLSSKRLKEEFVAREQELCKARDDPMLLELTERYVGKVFLDYEIAKPQRYKVVKIQYDNKGAAGTYYWEDTCVEVEPDGTGSWTPPARCLVSGRSDIIKTSCLIGYMLVDLADPENPRHVPWVDDYIARHNSTQN